MTKRVFLTAFVILLTLCCLFTAYCLRSFQELARLSETAYAAPL